MPALIPPSASPTLSTPPASAPGTRGRSADDADAHSFGAALDRSRASGASKTATHADAPADTAAADAAAGPRKAPRAADKKDELPTNLIALALLTPASTANAADPKRGLPAAGTAQGAKPGDTAVQATLADVRAGKDIPSASASHPATAAAPADADAAALAQAGSAADGAQASKAPAAPQAAPDAVQALAAQEAAARGARDAAKTAAAALPGMAQGSARTAAVTDDDVTGIPLAPMAPAGPTAAASTTAAQAAAGRANAAAAADAQAEKADAASSTAANGTPAITLAVAAAGAAAGTGGHASTSDDADGSDNGSGAAQLLQQPAAGALDRSGATAASAATAAAATVAPPVGSDGWGAALGQHMIRMSSSGQHVAELNLNPANLGPLKVTLTLGDNQAQAMFVSAHESVRKAVEAALPQLRTTLADQGISLGQASVGADTRQAGQGMGFGQEQQQQQRSAANAPAWPGNGRPAAGGSAEPLSGARPAGVARSASALDTFA